MSKKVELENKPTTETESRKEAENAGTGFRLQDIQG
jgi:hypothetical protein